jgi:hypothetical protein
VHISLLLRVIESVCIIVWNSCAFRQLMNPPHSLCVNVLDGSHCRGVRVDECSTHLSVSLSLSLHGTIISSHLNAPLYQITFAHEFSLRLFFNCWKDIHV